MTKGERIAEEFRRILKWRNVNMVLSKQDAELIYKLFFYLLDYANRKYNICPDIGRMRTASLFIGLFEIGRGLTGTAK